MNNVQLDGNKLVADMNRRIDTLQQLVDTYGKDVPELKIKIDEVGSWIEDIKLGKYNVQIWED